MSKKDLALSLLASAAFAALVVRGLDHLYPSTFAFDVADFLQRDVRDQRARVHGTLVPGTLCRIEEPCGYRFALVDSLAAPRREPTLPVSFDGCLIPETFLERPNQEHDVYVYGERCQSCHDFKATDILTRARKYVMAERSVPVLPPLCSTLEPRM
jgi:hypothetical protein